MAGQFQDRTEAGKQLAESLAGFADRPEVLVLALPRGGVPVAFEVAQALRAPLDVFVVRKLGTPGNEELAMGAIASGGIRVLNQHVVATLGIPADLIDEVAERELQELKRRERVYRKDRPAFDAQGRTVILIDDGIATGSTMQAALRALRQARPRRMVLAVPVAATPAIDLLRPDADEIVCVLPRPDLGSIGEWYDAFPQVEDAEVIRLLEAAAAPPPA